MLTILSTINMFFWAFAILHACFDFGLLPVSCNQKDLSFVISFFEIFFSGVSIKLESKRWKLESKRWKLQAKHWKQRKHKGKINFTHLDWLRSLTHQDFLHPTKIQGVQRFHATWNGKKTQAIETQTCRKKDPSYIKHPKHPKLPIGAANTPILQLEGRSLHLQTPPNISSWGIGEALVMDHCLL